MHRSFNKPWDLKEWTEELGGDNGLLLRVESGVTQRRRSWRAANVVFAEISRVQWSERKIRGSSGGDTCDKPCIIQLAYHAWHSNRRRRWSCGMWYVWLFPLLPLCDMDLIPCPGPIWGKPFLQYGTQAQSISVSVELWHWLWATGRNWETTCLSKSKKKHG